MRKQPDVWKRVAETFNRAGEASKKAGIQFAYHNHHFEFVPVNGTLPFDLLLKDCDPELVKIELDLCWTTVAGQDPLVLFPALSWAVPAGPRQGVEESARGRCARAVRSGDPQHHGRRARTTSSTGSGSSRSRIRPGSVITSSSTISRRRRSTASALARVTCARCDSEMRTQLNCRDRGTASQVISCRPWNQKPQLSL